MIRCTNLVLQKGKRLSVMVNKNKYSIPAILKKSVKFLGNTISDSLSDKHQVDNLF